MHLSNDGVGGVGAGIVDSIEAGRIGLGADCFSILDTNFSVRSSAIRISRYHCADFLNDRTLV